MSESKSEPWWISHRSLDWIKNRQATKNLISENDTCFHYAARLGLNYEEIVKHTERITKLKPFIDK